MDLSLIHIFKSVGKFGIGSHAKGGHDSIGFDEFSFTLLVDYFDTVVHYLCNAGICAGNNAGLFEVYLKRVLVDEHHVHSDIGLHLNNSAVLAVLSGHLKSKVGAGKPTAANSDFLALDGSWICLLYTSRCV